MVSVIGPFVRLATAAPTSHSIGPRLGEHSRAILDELGAEMSDRMKPSVATQQIITSVEPYQAQLLNKWRKGSLLVPGQTLGIIECAPAA